RGGWGEAHVLKRGVEPRADAGDAVLTPWPQWASHPASIVSAAPVIDHASSRQRNAAYRATSSGSMSRFTAFCVRSTRSTTSAAGIPCTRAWSAICRSTSGVRTYDGQIAFTVTPPADRAAASRATVFVRPTRPCFADTYADLYGDAMRLWTEPMFRMRPQPRAYIPGMSARMSAKGDVSITDRSLSHIDSSNSSTGLTCCRPALFTRMSMGPASSARAREEARRERSAAMPRAVG